MSLTAYLNKPSKIRHFNSSKPSFDLVMRSTVKSRSKSGKKLKPPLHKLNMTKQLISNQLTDD